MAETRCAITWLCFDQFPPRSVIGSIRSASAATASYISLRTTAERAERWLKLLALEPRRAAPVERVELRPDQPRHVGLHGLAVLALQIGEVAVAFGEAREQRRVEPHGRGRIDRIDAVALVDRLAQQHAPAVRALLEEIV